MGKRNEPDTEGELPAGYEDMFYKAWKEKQFESEYLNEEKKG